MHNAWSILSVVLVLTSTLSAQTPQSWSEAVAQAAGSQLPPTLPPYVQTCPATSFAMRPDSVALVGGRRLDYVYVWSAQSSDKVAEWTKVAIPSHADTLSLRLVGVLCGFIGVSDFILGGSGYYLRLPSMEIADGQTASGESAVLVVTAGGQSEPAVLRQPCDPQCEVYLGSVAAIQDSIERTAAHQSERTEREPAEEQDRSALRAPAPAASGSAQANPPASVSEDHVWKSKNPVTGLTGLQTLALAFCVTAIPVFVLRTIVPSNRDVRIGCAAFLLPGLLMCSGWSASRDAASATYNGGYKRERQDPGYLGTFSGSIAGVLVGLGMGGVVRQIARSRVRIGPFTDAPNGARAVVLKELFGLTAGHCVAVRFDGEWFWTPGARHYTTVHRVERLKSSEVIVSDNRHPHTLGPWRHARIDGGPDRRYSNNSRSRYSIKNRLRLWVDDGSYHKYTTYTESVAQIDHALDTIRSLIAARKRVNLAALVEAKERFDAVLSRGQARLAELRDQRKAAEHTLSASRRLLESPLSSGDDHADARRAEARAVERLAALHTAVGVQEAEIDGARRVWNATLQEAKASLAVVAHDRDRQAIRATLSGPR
jgi:hypothetical protein